MLLIIIASPAAERDQKCAVYSYRGAVIGRHLLQNVTKSVQYISIEWL
jgi:hypothetical protein